MTPKIAFAMGLLVGLLVLGACSDAGSDILRGLRGETEGTLTSDSQQAYQYLSDTYQVDQRRWANDYQEEVDKYNQLAVDYNELVDENNKLVADYNKLVAETNAQDQKRVDEYNKLSTDYNQLRSQALQNIDAHNQLVADYNKLVSRRAVIESVGTIALRVAIQSLAGGLLP